MRDVTNMSLIIGCVMCHIIKKVSEDYCNAT